MPDLLSKDITRTPLTNIAKSCEQKTKSHVCNPQDSGCLSAQEQRSTKISCLNISYFCREFKICLAF